MIAYRPAKPGKNGANMPHDVIDLAMNRHPDGFGIAWRERDEAGGMTLRVAKFGPQSRKAFRRQLKRVDRAGGEYVAHFRFATHGPKAQSHAHPYEYNDPDPEVGRVLLFHNGVINIYTTPQESDTEAFVRDVLAHLPSRWWRSPALRWLVNEAIGWSKFVIMTATETVNLHERNGEWDGGIWYSSSHKGWSYQSKGASTVGATAPSLRSDDAWEQEWEKWEQEQRKSARASAAILIPSEAESIRGYATSDYAYRHGGHNLSALKDMDRTVDGDYEDAVICDSCLTTGDVYWIDGSCYIDMGHRYGDLAADKWEEELLDDATAAGRGPRLVVDNDALLPA